MLFSIAIIGSMSSCTKEYMDLTVTPVLDTIHLIPVEYEIFSTDSNASSLQRRIIVMSDYRLHEIALREYELVPVYDTVFATGDTEIVVFVPVINDFELTMHKHAVAGVVEWASTDSTYSHTVVNIYTEYGVQSHSAGSCIDDGREIPRMRNGEINPLAVKYFKVLKEE